MIKKLILKGFVVSLSVLPGTEGFATEYQESERKFCCPPVSLACKIEESITYQDQTFYISHLQSSKQKPEGALHFSSASVARLKAPNKDSENKLEIHCTYHNLQYEEWVLVTRIPLASRISVGPGVEHTKLTVFEFYYTNNPDHITFIVPSRPSDKKEFFHF